jgi:hypothetical protein
MPTCAPSPDEWDHMFVAQWCQCAASWVPRMGPETRQLGESRSPTQYALFFFHAMYALGSTVIYTVNRPVSAKKIPICFTGETDRFTENLIYTHGLRVGIRSVHVQGQTCSTRNRPNRPGSHRFREPCSEGEIEYILLHLY